MTLPELEDEREEDETLREEDPEEDLDLEPELTLFEEVPLEELREERLLTDLLLRPEICLKIRLIKELDFLVFIFRGYFFVFISGEDEYP